jgi:hypothetical protein
MGGGPWAGLPRAGLRRVESVSETEAGVWVEMSPARLPGFGGAMDCTAVICW